MKQRKSIRKVQYLALALGAITFSNGWNTFIYKSWRQLS